MKQEISTFKSKETKLESKKQETVGMHTYNRCLRTYVWYKARQARQARQARPASIGKYISSSQNHRRRIPS
jgi:hypothetical protein